VRAPGSKVTLAPPTRAGSGGLNSGSIRTVPVNQSAGPLPEGCEPLRLISTVVLLFATWADRRPADSILSGVGLSVRFPQLSRLTNFRLTDAVEKVGDERSEAHVLELF
jgi:hypothetical protein